MANRELKALKKQLLALQNERDKEKEYIKAKNGLFEINFKTGEKRKLDIVPEDAKINYIDALMENILICPGNGEPIVIVDDIANIEAETIKVLNLTKGSQCAANEHLF